MLSVTSVSNVARGAAIGVVETVPGVSGGTMALIVGVYERLIAVAGHLVAAVRAAVSDLPRGRGGVRARTELGRVDVPLVAAVGAGMVLALAIASQILPDLIEGRPVGTRAVFFGMVAASVLVPALALGRLRAVHEPLVVVAAAGATWVLTGLPTPAGDGGPSLWLVGGAAALAVCALVLPGLSGSFLLLVLGLYEPTLRAVASGDVAYLAVFALGAALGLGSFVSLLQWLLERHHRTMMLVMAGVLLGALRALWPWQDADRAMAAPDPGAAAMLVPMLLGAVFVVAVTLWQHRRTGLDG
ncbi:putative membrane protein [Pseudonocardia sediminis]|uniref:Putative membrane protein n=1 Tax=Pseudonocardia sediminis TaxID=1397368 RepID=A0A4Q7V1J8_PSEST|nr:DUF368 domain-containing protein [Pseudonocardia sediminis]RZT86473.1 putative membrane protein [Pseudonocardia sediminis]